MAKKEILTNSRIEQDIKNILKHPADLSKNEYQKSLVPYYVFLAVLIVAMAIFQGIYRGILFVALLLIIAYLAVSHFRSKNNIKSVSIDDYEIKNEVASYVKEEKYTVRNSWTTRYTVCVYMMYFENGKCWNIPKDNYQWSGECPLSDRTIYQTTNRGDIFTVVTKKDTGEIVMAYPTDFFEYKN